MQKLGFKFSNSTVDYYLGGSMTQLKGIAGGSNLIIVTDENVFNAHSKRFRNWNSIVLKAGEEFKVQETANRIIEQLIAMEADRQTILVGVGGGVVTDITGYVASLYMRGIRFGFLPTSLLAMVDASIGGKNGIDLGVYKNIVGIIRQPAFILHDMTFLNTLPPQEWENGFAEIIKHACIKDAAMFRTLVSGSIKKYQKGKRLISELVKRNAILKTRVVQQDEFEKGDRKLLNFGHTLGHALENQYELSHGQAISIGMTYASHISAQLNGFRGTTQVVEMLERYGLPTYAKFDREKVFNVLKMDKKRERTSMNYVLLEKIGKAVIRPIPITRLESIIHEL